MLFTLKTTLLNMTNVQITNSLTTERQHRAQLALALAAHCMYYIASMRRTDKSYNRIQTRNLIQ